MQKEEILVNIQTAELQKPKLTREQMTAWFAQVYVFDDKLVLAYNYQHGTQTISLEEIESALSSDFDGATPPIKNDPWHDSMDRFFIDIKPATPLFYDAPRFYFSFTESSAVIIGSVDPPTGIT